MTNNKNELFYNGGDSFTESYTIKNYREKSLFSYLLHALIIAFVVILAFNIFRHFLSNEWLTFSQFINAINECPNYFGDIMEFLNQNVSFVGGDSSNLPIIGGLIDFLSTTLGIIVYFFGAAYSGLRYFVYFISLLFQG